MKIGNRFSTFLLLIGRLLLGVVFIYAAIEKINSPQDFADRLASYQVLPPSVINIVTLCLPLFELGCGLLVLSGFYLRIGSLGILVMLFIFSAVILVAHLRGLSLDCGCFSSHSFLDATPRGAFIRDLVLFALAAFVYRFGNHGTSPLKNKI